MRLLAFAASCLLAASLSSCAPQTEEARATQEAGGTIPWNRPASWEGSGVLGSQMQGMQSN